MNPSTEPDASTSTPSRLPDGSLILRIARRHARRTLPSWAGVADVADQAGYLALVICERLGAYDPRLADFGAFCHLVAATAAINRWQYETSPIRDRRRTIPIQELIEFVDREAPEATPVDPGLRRDVHRLVRALPGDQQQLCEALIEHPKEEAARRLGVSKGKLYRDVRRLRRVFSARGLGDYVRHVAD
jgi:DNA-directed RNA polymerase specialized sigma24 family protein